MHTFHIYIRMPTFRVATQPCKCITNLFRYLFNTKKANHSANLRRNLNLHPRIILLRSPQPLLRIKIHRIYPIASLALIQPLRLPNPQRHKRLIRTQQRARERIAPIDTESWTRDLHPSLNITHQGQLAGENLAEQQVHPFYAAPTQVVLDERKRVRVPLAAQRAEDQAPGARLAGGQDGGAAQGVQRVVGVGLVRKTARVRVVAVGGQAGVRDHGGLEVEAAVAEVEQEVGRRVLLPVCGGKAGAGGSGQGRRGAAEDFAFGERCDLRD